MITYSQLKLLTKLPKKFLIEKATAYWPFLTLGIVIICIVACIAINLFSFYCLVTTSICCRFY